ncbi:MAG: type transport system permease protein [Thermoleophilaceae bacterium]|jgi:ABC-2 type transport system permease protein|nr:type transport system permease protein [Thermoleophilaceae bacterium]
MTASPLAIQVGHLARRSIMRTMRQPAIIIPGTTFPLFLLAVNAGGLDAATKLPGFPTHSYLTFALAITFMQAALFATNAGGSDLAEDIRTGFLSRLSLTPLRGSALLAGQLAGILALGLFQAVVFIAVGLAAGGHIAAGVAGVLVLIALSVLTGLAFGTLGMLIGLRTGSGEAVQGFFPLLFVMLFLSSMSLPRNLIEQDWFRTVATYNPVSYLIEGFRSLLIYGWDGQALAQGFAVAATIFVVALAASARALQTRMVRT